MTENNTVKERLISFIKYLNIGQAKFEARCGLANGYVNNIRRSITPDKLQLIALQYPDLNTGWLMTGEGEMLRATVCQNGNGNNNQQGDGNVYHSDEEAYKALMVVVEANQKTSEHFIEIVRKSQEQIDRLIALLEKK